MHPSETVSKELFLKNLQRAAWRLQYQTRKQLTREIAIQVELYSSSPSFALQVDSDIYVQELINQLPSEKARYIFRRLFVDGLTEQEVALELNMSQQAVSKWKKKGVSIMREKMSHSLDY